MSVYTFRLKQIVSVETEEVPRDQNGRQTRVPVCKAFQYVHLDRDSANTWRGWEFEASDRGLVIRSPLKCDEVLVPWGEVEFVKFRPKAEKKVVK